MPYSRVQHPQGLGTQTVRSSNPFQEIVKHPRRAHVHPPIRSVIPGWLPTPNTTSTACTLLYCGVQDYKQGKHLREFGTGAKFHKRFSSHNGLRALGAELAAAHPPLSDWLLLAAIPRSSCDSDGHGDLSRVPYPEQLHMNT